MSRANKFYYYAERKDVYDVKNHMCTRKKKEIGDQNEAKGLG